MESAVTQHSPKPSLDGANATEGESTRASLDAAGIRPASSSSSQLADSALSSLRKTLASQRPASPASTAKSPEGQPRPRTTLEDRLKAKFAIGEASNGTSPSQSTRSTPSTTPIPVVDHPLSPAPPEAQPPSPEEDAHILSPKSVPLPDSPVTLLAIASPNPRTAAATHPLASIESDSPPTLHLDAKESSGTVPLDAALVESPETSPHDEPKPNASDETPVSVELDTADVGTDVSVEHSTSTPPDLPSQGHSPDRDDPEPITMVDSALTTSLHPPLPLAKEESTASLSPTVEVSLPLPLDAPETSAAKEISTQTTDGQDATQAAQDPITPSPTVPEEDVATIRDIPPIQDEHAPPEVAPEDPYLSTRLQRPSTLLTLKLCNNV